MGSPWTADEGKDFQARYRSFSCTRPTFMQLSECRTKKYAPQPPRIFRLTDNTTSDDKTNILDRLSIV